MQLDFIKIANDMRNAHRLGISYRLPPMTMRQLTSLIAALDAPGVPTQLH